MAAALPAEAMEAAPLRRSLTRGRVCTELLSGGVAGCVAKTATAPLARLTVLAQTSSLLAPSALAAAHQPSSCRGAFTDGGIVRGLRHIVRSEGVSALWKGNVCTLVHRFPCTGVNFLTVETSKRYFSDLIERHWWGKLLPGATAAVSSVAVCYPLEVVRTRLMARAGGRRQAGHIHWWRSLLLLSREEGLAGMYRGVGLSLAVTVPSLATSFGVYAAIQEAAKAQGFSELEVSFVAGGVAGIAGSALTFPLDVLRRRRQVMGMDASVPMRDWRQEARHILRSDGVVGFYRGLAPELAKVFPTVALTFMTYEQMRLLAKLWGS